MSDKKFATVINCMDGRTQEPAIFWIKKEFGVDYVDSITEAGPDKILAEGPSDTSDSIKKRVKISVDKHGSENIIVVSHHDCAGNPVSKEQHMIHLKNAIKHVSDWKLDAKVTGIWIDENWDVNKII